jgi:exosome complex component RRP43
VGRSGALELRSLCIHPGKAVWVLYVDATCINYDGNAFDATLMAMVAALKNSASITMSSRDLSDLDFPFFY